jgi:hypothetical protein
MGHRRTKGSELNCSQHFANLISSLHLRECKFYLLLSFPNIWTLAYTEQEIYTRVRHAVIFQFLKKENDLSNAGFTDTDAVHFQVVRVSFMNSYWWDYRLLRSLDPLLSTRSTGRQLSAWADIILFMTRRNFNDSECHLVTGSVRSIVRRLIGTPSNLKIISTIISYSDKYKSLMMFCFVNIRTK